MRFTTSLKKLLFSIFIMVGVILMTAVHSKANMFLDSDGNICFATSDKKKGSSVWYKTYGLTISRGEDDPVQKSLHPSRQFVTFFFDEASKVEDNTGYTAYTYFKIPTSTLIAKASAVDGAWGEEIQKALDGEGAVALRGDCIMMTLHGSTPWRLGFSNTAREDQEAPDLAYGRGQTINSAPNPKAIAHAEGWANPSGLNSHYRRWFIYGKNKEFDPVSRDVGDDYCITEFHQTKPGQGGTPKPGGGSGGGSGAGENIGTEGSPFVFKTGNSSDTYNLREGIPSGRSVVNEYLASTYYLESQVWARAVTDDEDRPGGSYADVKFKYTYTIEGTEYEIERTFEQGESLFDLDFSHTLHCEVGYTYLVDANVYTLSDTNIYNLAWGGAIGYSYDFDDLKVQTTKDFQDIHSSPVSGDIDWNPDNEQHIEWGKVNTYEKDFGEYETYEDFLIDAKEQFKEDRADLVKCAEKTVTRNDLLKVGETTYVRGGTVDEDYDVEGVYWLKKDEDAYKGKEFYQNAGISQTAMKVHKYEAGTIEETEVPTTSESQEAYIPPEVDNGLYSSAIECLYVRKANKDYQPLFHRAGYDWFHTYNDGSFYSDAPNQLSPEHCLDGYDGQIFVHTPVISPFAITLPDGTSAHEATQTVSEITNGSVDFQLLLDSEYILDWSQMTHRSIPGYGDSTKSDGGETYSKYDEFVQTKWVQFPFDVVYNGKIYEARNDYGTGVLYTDWIELMAPTDSAGVGGWQKPANFAPASEGNDWESSSENHWRKFPFYIPSFATEIGKPGEEALIKCLVEAYNTDGMYGGDHNDEAIWGNNDWLVTDGDGSVSPSTWWEQWEKGANYNAHTDDYAPQGARYVTAYYASIQLSGIIYDFTITGSSDKDGFRYEDTGTRVIGDHVPFCSYKIEKKTGNKNRLGGSTMRYRIDGDITHDWKYVNTIPLMAGKSNSTPGMGYVMKGSNFSFSFKTIANLDSQNDSIIIKPTFTYIRPDGTKTKNIKVYYHSPTSNEYYVEYGTADDLAPENTQYVKLSHKQFNDSYYEHDNGSYTNDMTDYTKQIKSWVDREKWDKNYTPNKEGISYENFMNRETPSYCLSYIKLPYQLRMLSGEWDQLKRNNQGNGRRYTAMKTYWDFVPVEVNGTGEYVGGANNFSPYFEEFRDSMQTWFGQYYIPANLFIIDLERQGLDDSFDLKQYAQSKHDAGEGGLSQTDPIFETNRGYLIINFDIRTRNEGQPHLQYAGGNGGNNMWITEGQDLQIEIDPDPTDDDPTPKPIPLEPGDVAIIDMSYSIQNKYGAAIFNIN